MLNDLFGEKMSIDNGNSSQNPTSVAKISKPPEPRSNCGFVGLQNQGATCYLNSLIQAMYMTPELREGLYQIDPDELGVNVSDESKGLETSPSLATAFEIDENILLNMLEYGLEENGCRKAIQAVNNRNLDEATDFYFKNEDIIGFHDPLHKDLSSNSTHINGNQQKPKKKKKRRQIPLELQRLFTQMQLLNSATLSTEDLTRKGFQWQGVDGRVQHDAHELNRLLVDALEKSLKHTTGEKLCQELYHGILVHRTQCLNCSTIKETMESYYDILLQVIGCEDLATSLRMYTAGEILEGDNMYYCDTCNCKQVAQRGIILKTLPRILTFSCQRFDIDRATWQRVKVTSKSIIPLLLDMNPFSDNNNNNNNNNEGSNGSGNGSVFMPISDDINFESDLLTSLRSSMVWIDDVIEEANKIATQLVDQYGTDIDISTLHPITKLEISNKMQSADWLLQHSQDNSQIYELLAIVMHRGSAYSGHYFAYIRDCLGEGHWEYPPDEVLSEVNKLKEKKKKESMGSSSSTMKNGLSGGGTTTTTTTTMTTNSNDYYFIRDMSHTTTTTPTTIVIDEDSALGRIIVIVQSEGDTGGDEEVGDGEQQSMPCIAQKLIASCLKRNLGRTWTDLYKSKYGTVNEFITAHPTVFMIEQGYVYLKPNELELVSSEEFLMMKSHFIASSNGSVSVSGKQSVDDPSCPPLSPNVTTYTKNDIDSTSSTVKTTDLSPMSTPRSTSTSSTTSSLSSSTTTTIKPPRKTTGTTATTTPTPIDLTDSDMEADEAIARALQESFNVPPNPPPPQKSSTSSNNGWTEAVSKNKKRNLRPPGSSIPARHHPPQNKSNQNNGAITTAKTSTSMTHTKSPFPSSSIPTPSKITGNKSFHESPKKANGIAPPATAGKVIHSSVNNRSSSNSTPSTATSDRSKTTTPDNNPQAGSITSTTSTTSAAAAAATIVEVVDISTDTLEEKEESRNLAIATVAQNLLSTYHGQFFEFNDSIVKPIPIQTLKKSFEGRDCAYLLVYRRKDKVSSSYHTLLSDPSQTEGIISNENNNSSSSKEFDLPCPPSYWSEKVLEFNNYLTHSRSLFEIQSNNLLVKVYFPIHIKRKECLLLLKEPTKIKLDSNPGNNNTHNNHHSLELTANAKDTLSQLQIMIWNHIATHITDILEVSPPIHHHHEIEDTTHKGMTGNDPSSWFTTGDLVVSKLLPVGNSAGYHVSLPLGSEVLLGELSEVERQHLVVWNGVTLGGDIILSGDAGLPIKVKVSQLQLNESVTKPPVPLVSSGGGGKDPSSHPIVIVPSSCYRELWLPKSLSESMLCQQVVELLGLNLDDCCLHTLEKKNKVEAGHEKGIYVRRLNKRWGSGQLRTNKSEGTLEEWSMHEILVEENTAKGLYSYTLAEMYATQRNSMWSISVEFSAQLFESITSATTTTDSSSLVTEVVDNATESSRSTIADSYEFVDLEFLFGKSDNNNNTTTTSTQTMTPKVTVETEKCNTIWALKALVLQAIAYYFEDHNKTNLFPLLPMLQSSDFMHKLSLLSEKQRDIIFVDSATLEVSGLYDGIVLILENMASRKTNGDHLSRNNTSNNSVMDVDNNNGSKGTSSSSVTMLPTITLQFRTQLIESNSGNTIDTTTTMIDNMIECPRDIISLLVSPIEKVVDVKRRAMLLLLGEGLGEGIESNAQLQQSSSTSNPLEKILDNWRLRSTNWAGEAAELLVEDEGCSIEHALTQTTGFKGDALILLERGKAPKKGTVCLQFFIWDLNHAVESPQDITGSPSITGKPANDLKGKSGKDSNLFSSYPFTYLRLSPLLLVPAPTATTTTTTMVDMGSTESTTAVSSIDHIVATKRQFLRPLGEHRVKEDWTLLELYTYLYDLLHLESSTLEVTEAVTKGTHNLPKSVEHMLLRILRFDHLPGKTLWLSDLPHSQLDLSNIGVAQGSRGKKNGGGGGGAGFTTIMMKEITAKKIAMNAKFGVVIQIHDKNQKEMRGMAGAVPIWIHRLINPGALEAPSIMSPTWPPLPGIIVPAGASYPNCRHLTHCVASTLGIPPERCRIFKFNTTTRCSWFEVKPGMKATSAGGRGSGGGGRGRGGRHGRSSGNNNSGQLDNILQSPYAFSEGDLVCAFDSNECSDETITPTPLLILREEDKYEKDCKKNKTKKKNEQFFTNSTQSKAAGSGKKRRSLEISLSIKGDFDYSDDESEDDSILEL